MEQKVELLSPAGSKEAAYAALQYGADAIYLGLKKFSARAEADNLDLSELREIVGYAHSLGKKVMVTLNTLVQVAETEELCKTLSALATLELDALIIQDLGVLRLAREIVPHIPLHASTQLVIHNTEGARFAKKLGFSRVVLARELTLPEIDEIASIPGLESEVFIHGALCYSYSGLCFFSSMKYGLSGNRGRCMYPCRDNYMDIETGENFLPFSMKDLSLAKLLPKLSKVTSLKIEGRKKSPLYVAAVTKFYRALLDGKTKELPQLEEDLKTIFSRPWTEFNLRSPKSNLKPAQGVIDPNWTGHRGTVIGKVEGIRKKQFLCFTTSRALELHDGIQLDLIDHNKPFGFAVDVLYNCSGKNPQSVTSVPAGTKVEIQLPQHRPNIPLNIDIYCASSQAVKQKYDYVIPKAVPAKLPLSVNLKVNSDVTEVFVETGLQNTVVSAEIKRGFRAEPTVKHCDFEKPFTKLGESNFYLADFKFDNPENLFLPLSFLNELRREACAVLWEKIEGEISKKAKLAYTALVQEATAKQENSKYLLKTDDPALLKSLSEFKNLSECIFEISVKTQYLPEDSEIRIALPPIIRSHEKQFYKDSIKKLYSAGFRKFEVSNLGSFGLLADYQELDISSSFSCYALNPAAIHELKQLGVHGITLSPEDDMENIESLIKLFPDELNLIVYQDTPLFTSEACLYAAKYGCKGKANCGFKELELESRGERYFVKNYDCRTVLFSKKPFYIQNPPRGINYKVEFINRSYSLEDALRIWETVQNRYSIQNSTNGNIIRGLK